MHTLFTLPLLSQSFTSPYLPPSTAYAPHCACSGSPRLLRLPSSTWQASWPSTISRGQRSPAVNLGGDSLWTHSTPTTWNVSEVVVAPIQACLLIMQPENNYCTVLVNLWSFVWLFFAQSLHATTPKVSCELLFSLLLQTFGAVCVHLCNYEYQIRLLQHPVVFLLILWPAWVLPLSCWVYPQIEFVKLQLIGFSSVCQWREQVGFISPTLPDFLSLH